MRTPCTPCTPSMESVHASEGILTKHHHNRTSSSTNLQTMEEQEMNLLEETINEAVKENLKTTSDNIKISDKDTTTTNTTTELATDASSIVICVEDTVSPSSDFNQHLIRSRSSEALQRLNPDRFLEPSEPRVVRGDSCPTDTLQLTPECRLTGVESNQSADFPAKSSESSLRTLSCVDKNSVILQNETRLLLQRECHPYLQHQGESSIHPFLPHYPGDSSSYGHHHHHQHAGESSPISSHDDSAIADCMKSVSGLSSEFRSQEQSEGRTSEGRMSSELAEEAKENDQPEVDQHFMHNRQSELEPSSGVESQETLAGANNRVQELDKEILEDECEMLNLDLEAGGNVRTWDTFSLSSQLSQFLQKDMRSEI